MPRGPGQGIKDGRLKVAFACESMYRHLQILEAHEFPGLREVGEPVAPGYYVIFVGRNEEGLRRKLNESILLEIEDGSLERMYRKYNLWNEDQRQLSKVALDWPPKVETLATGWSDLPSFGLRLLNSAGITIVLSCLSMPLAILIGLMVATGRL